MKFPGIRYILPVGIFVALGVGYGVYAAITFDTDSETTWYGPNMPGFTDPTMTVTLSQDFSNMDCPGTPTYSCTGTKPTANLTTSNDTGLTADTSWQNTVPTNKCYYKCTDGFTGPNCDPAKVDGVCSPTYSGQSVPKNAYLFNNFKLSLCTSGDAVEGSGWGAATGPWTWTCSGKNGGDPSSECKALANTSITCGASNNKVLAAAPTTELCSDASTPSVTTDASKFTWTCGTASCQADLNSNPAFAGCTREQQDVPCSQIAGDTRYGVLAGSSSGTVNLWTCGTTIRVEGICERPKQRINPCWSQGQVACSDGGAGYEIWADLDYTCLSGNTESISNYPGWLILGADNKVYEPNSSTALTYTDATTGEQKDYIYPNSFLISKNCVAKKLCADVSQQISLTADPNPVLSNGDYAIQGGTCTVWLSGLNLDENESSGIPQSNTYSTSLDGNISTRYTGDITCKKGSDGKGSFEVSAGAKCEVTVTPTGGGGGGIDCTSSDGIVRRHGYSTVKTSTIAGVNHSATWTCNTGEWKCTDLQHEGCTNTTHP